MAERIRSIKELRRALERATPEKEFRQQVVDLARAHNWLVYWTWNSIHSPAGFPDLVMARDRRLIFAELKSEGGKVNRGQQQWLELLDCLDEVEVYVWRPSDWSKITLVLE